MQAQKLTALAQRETWIFDYIALLMDIKAPPEAVDAVAPAPRAVIDRALAKITKEPAVIDTVLAKITKEPA